VEAGRKEGTFRRVDICTYTEELASTFRSAIERSGMHLRIRSDQITDDVYLDIDMWERIILNLVSNAFKYSNEGEIGVDITESNQMVHVAVSDTGVGIPSNQLIRIFDRFYRVENAAGRSQEGTGIGLAMVRELVKLHHGIIKVSSELGKGSVFTVSIPVGKAHIAPERIAEMPEFPGFRYSTAFAEEAMKWISTEPNEAIDKKPDEARAKVLLADDNADMRGYVKRLLSEQFNVITAKDGEEAFQKAVDFRPDLLLSDIMMPKLDGFGLLAKVRQHPELKNTPVIFLSARAGEEAKVEGLDAGADDYVVKPFSAKELMVRVTNHIRINQVRRETESQFYQLFLQAPALINIFKGPDFRYELFHPKNKEIFGDVDYTGKPLAEVIPELKAQGIIKLMEEVYREGKTIYEWERLVVFRNASGEMIDRYFNFTYQPWHDLKGNIQGVLNFAIDVTEQVLSRKSVEDSQKKYRDISERLEGMVEQRTKELRRSNDDLQQFAHVASHDLKEPVRKLKTFINRLDDEFGTSIPPRGMEYINKMRQASSRMYSMIDGVLRYSSMNESIQATEDVDLNEVIDSIQVDLEIIISQKEATIRKGDLPTLQGAHVLLYQLFYNLINNSLKFNNSKPEITIVSSLIKKGEKFYSEIVVKDNGIGFDQKFSMHVFDAFLRLHSKDKYEGTGLGLALCKKIVERHRGTITAAGVEGKGSTFTIVLPLAQEDNRI
jgi:signal transduction histidine kinase/CheY-like chemotaxis protein